MSIAIFLNPFHAATLVNSFIASLDIMLCKCETIHSAPDSSPYMATHQREQYQQSELKYNQRVELAQYLFNCLAAPLSSVWGQRSFTA